MSINSLLQYKESFYGRWLPRKPKTPFQEYQFLSTINNNVFGQPLSSDQLPSPRETSRKKYVLFCSEIAEIKHPLLPSIAATYFKCLINDPYLEEGISVGWIRDIWVEPLNPTETYFEENLAKVREKFVRMSKDNSSRLTREQFQELGGLKMGLTNWNGG
jgi:hypothetical protein